MTGVAGVAWVLAAVAAVVYGGGSILQSVGARRAREAGRGTLGAVLEWPFTAGLACDLAAWLLSLAALRTLPLFAVQAVLAASVAATVVLAHFLLGARLRRIDTVAVGVVVAALGVIGLASGPEHPQRLGRPGEIALLLVAPGLAAAALLVRRAGPIAVGAIAGLAFGGAALCARAAHPDATVAGFVRSPLVWGVALFTATGVACYTHALGHGHVGSVTAALWAAQVVVPSAVGVALLDDHVRRGWGVPATLALLVAVGATVVLASSPAERIATTPLERSAAG